MLLEMIATLAAGLFAGSVWWLVGGVLLVAVIPYTVIIVLPTNNRLLDPAIGEKNPDLARRLLIRWGRLHTVRSIMSLAAFLAFMLLL
jgi:hypothetical protein